MPTWVDTESSAYDGLGWFYDRHWKSVSDKLLPALDKLVLADLQRGSRVLDLCCGTGRLMSALARRKFCATGVDGSEDMIRFARETVPQATFAVLDARCFQFRPVFRAVISTGDSMNHIATAQELRNVFANVYRALEPGGRFVFDVNMSEAFETQWSKSSTISEPDNLIYVRGRYDRKMRVGTTQITAFRMEKGWKRLDLNLKQYCYTQKQFRQALEDSGFSSIAAHRARDIGIRGRLAVGRIFFVAQKLPHAVKASAPYD